MKIQVGKYTLCSDPYSLWIEEEYEGQDSIGRKKMQKRRVAGYAPSMKLLTDQFCGHKYRSSDAETMRELLKVMTQTFEDMVELNEKAVKADFKVVRKIMKEKGVK